MQKQLPEYEPFRRQTHCRTLTGQLNQAGHADISAQKTSPKAELNKLNSAHIRIERPIQPRFSTRQAEPISYRNLSSLINDVDEWPPADNHYAKNYKSIRDIGQLMPSFDSVEYRDRSKLKIRLPYEKSIKAILRPTEYTKQFCVGQFTGRGEPDFDFKECPVNFSDRPQYLKSYDSCESDKKSFVRPPIQTVERDRKQLKETVSTLATLTPKSHQSGGNPTTKKSNSISIADFEVVKECGQGKFSTVSIVRHKRTKFLMAMKTISKSRIRKEHLATQVLRQIKICSFVKHPNIVCLYGFFDDQDNVYLLFELGCDGQLYKKLQRIGKYSQQATSYITRQVLLAVDYLHGINVLHRDIKPENVVVSHGNVKICDLGWSVHTGKNQLRATMCGTPLYASPELLKGQKYNLEIDLWAIGILAYELFFGDIPFNITMEDQLFRIITDDVTFPEDSSASEQFKNFIRCILRKNPNQRLSCQQLLSHPFITKYEGLETCQELCSQ